MTRILISALVIVHLVATIWHGDAHKKLSIELEPSKTIFVYAVILIGPVVAALLVWTRFMSAGLWVFALSMLAAFLFGAYHHYVLVSPDNIGHLPAGSSDAHSQFINSAAAIALLELGATLTGAFCLGFRYRALRGKNT
jgi:NADPH:quinone reductase-like Zn-dependent oxidoreductase